MIDRHSRSDAESGGNRQQKADTGSGTGNGKTDTSRTDNGTEKLRRMGSGAEHYTAFISYRHDPEDIRAARQVQRYLEHYPIPRVLQRETGKKRLGKVFRDKEDLPVTEDLNRTIPDALRDADFLIVICSTHTKESVWVTREIIAFLENHKRSHVLTVLVDGEPREVIPEVLLHDGDRQLEPLSCDLRLPRRQARRQELPRLAAALLGVSYDTLIRRAHAYAMRRTVILLSIVLTVVLAFTMNLWVSRQKISESLEKVTISRSQYLSSEARKAEENDDYILSTLLGLAAVPQEEKTREKTPQVYQTLAHALNTGEEQSWRQNLRLQMDSNLSCLQSFPDDDCVVAVDIEGNLALGRISTGEVLLRRAIEGYSDLPVQGEITAYGDDALLVRDQPKDSDGFSSTTRLTCISKANGKILWTEVLPQVTCAVAAAETGCHPDLYVAEPVNWDDDHMELLRIDGKTRKIVDRKKTDLTIDTDIFAGGQVTRDGRRVIFPSEYLDEAGNSAIRLMVWDLQEDTAQSLSLPSEGDTQNSSAGDVYSTTSKILVGSRMVILDRDFEKDDDSLLSEYRRELIAVDLEKGSVVWRKTVASSPSKEALSWTVNDQGHQLLQVLTGQQVLCLDPQTGETQYSSAFSSAPLSAQLLYVPGIQWNQSSASSDSPSFDSVPASLITCLQSGEIFLSGTETQSGDLLAPLYSLTMPDDDNNWLSCTRRGGQITSIVAAGGSTVRVYTRRALNPDLHAFSGMKNELTSQSLQLYCCSEDRVLLAAPNDQLLICADTTKKKVLWEKKAEELFPDRETPAGMTLSGDGGTCYVRTSSALCAVRLSNGHITSLQRIVDEMQSADGILTLSDVLQKGHWLVGLDYEDVLHVWDLDEAAERAEKQKRGTGLRKIPLDQKKKSQDGLLESLGQAGGKLLGIDELRSVAICVDQDAAPRLIFLSDGSVVTGTPFTGDPKASSGGRTTAAENAAGTAATDSAAAASTSDTAAATGAVDSAGTGSTNDADTAGRTDTIDAAGILNAFYYGNSYIAVDPDQPQAAIYSPVDHRVYVMEEKSGKCLWMFSLGRAKAAGMLFVQDQLIVFTDRDNAVRFDLSDGRRVESFSLQLRNTLINWEDLDFRAQETPEGWLFVGASRQTEQPQRILLDPVNWRVLDDYYGLVYSPAADCLVGAGTTDSSNTLGLYSLPVYSLNDLIERAQEEMKNQSFNAEEKAAYGLN